MCNIEATKKSTAAKKSAKKRAKELDIPKKTYLFEPKPIKLLRPPTKRERWRSTLKKLGYSVSGLSLAGGNMVT